jgi:predicted dehydrogenase
VADGGKVAGTPSPNPQIGMIKPPVVSEEPLQAEIKSFLNCVRTRTKPEVSLEEGRRALAVALDITRAIREHGHKAGLDQLVRRPQ